MASKDFVWYVYELADADGNVFYVGKGKGNRIDAHEHEARSGKQSHKCNKIRSIWENGGSVEKRKVAFFCDEQQAYIHEADRIAEYGLENLTNAVLCCALVSNKKKIKPIVDSAKFAFDVIQALAQHFASYVYLTQFGRRKLKFSGAGAVASVLYGMFYNEMAPKVVSRVMKSEKYRPQFVELMLKHNVQIVIPQA